MNGGGWRVVDPDARLLIAVSAAFATLIGRLLLTMVLNDDGPSPQEPVRLAPAPWCHGSPASNSGG